MKKEKKPAIIVELRWMPPRGKTGYLRKAITLHCSVHPGYLGVYPPRVPCAACRRLYTLETL